LQESSLAGQQEMNQLGEHRQDTSQFCSEQPQQCTLYPAPTLSPHAAMRLQAYLCPLQPAAWQAALQ
jgi:hypothetical protein